ncbi:hypothetical protein I3760_13G000600 [Carya illinoinensis]|nr:hypothetical protein I3760_13G000600 [Carya illinoinensis]
MSNLTKLKFVALDISGKNHLSWILDAEIHLNVMNLKDTIKEVNQGKKYEHQKTVILPKARHDWMHLRLQNFKSVGEYNSALFKIRSLLKLCGEKVTDNDLLEKTYTTFYVSNVLMHSISFLEVNSTRFTQFPEVNGASFQRNRGCERDRKNYRNRGSRSDHTKRDNNRYTPHWSRTCRTTKHLVNLYQTSIKEKIKKFETNFTEPSDALVSIDGEYITNLDVSNFFEDSSGRVNHLIGDGSVPF